MIVQVCLCVLLVTMIRFFFRKVCLLTFNFTGKFLLLFLPPTHLFWVLSSLVSVFYLLTKKRSLLPPIVRTVGGRKGLILHTKQRLMAPSLD